jgi:hypothetical protein
VLYTAFAEGKKFDFGIHTIEKKMLKFEFEDAVGNQFTLEVVDGKDVPVNLG